MSYRTEKTENGIDIVISGWEQGIIDNPYEDIYDMRNCDAVTIPGEVSVAMSTQSMITQGRITNVAFTCDHTTETFTYDGVVPLEVNTAIIFTGADLPNGLTQNTTAYYIKTTPTPTTFTVSEVCAGGALKTVSDNGTGTMTFSTINMGTPGKFTTFLFNNFYRLYFTQDSNGRCWFYDTSILGNTNKWIYMHNLGSESSLGTPNGIEAYKGYLFNFTPTSIVAMSIIDFSTITPTVTQLTTKANWISWKTLLTNTYTTISHQSLVGQDDYLYICNDTSIASISEIAGSATTTYPQYVSPFSLAETHTVANGVTTNTSTAISTVSAFFTSTDVGAVISGTGIPTGAFIVSVTNSKNAVLSDAAIADGSGITFTITKSYNYNASALALPSTDSANCLAELGTNLMIGGKNNYIYPWDRLSTSFNFPIFLSENYVSRMVTINTTMYIFAGYKGRIFITNGANATPFWKIPEYLSKTTNPYIIWKDATFNRNQLYFSFSMTTNSGTTINECGGLWAVDVDAVAPVAPRLQNQMSYGTYSGYASALFQNRGLLLTSVPSSDGYGLFIGWNDGTNGGIDKTISTPYTAGQAYIDTDPIPVGQYLTKKTFSSLEYKLGVPLVSGESIAIAYRTDLNSSYTDVPITQGGQTGDISGWGSVNFEKVQWIQFRITLTSTATNPSYCRLREMRLR